MNNGDRTNRRANENELVWGSIAACYISVLNTIHFWDMRYNRSINISTPIRYYICLQLAWSTSQLVSVKRKVAFRYGTVSLLQHNRCYFHGSTLYSWITYRGGGGGRSGWYDAARISEEELSLWTSFDVSKDYYIKGINSKKPSNHFISLWNFL